MLKYVFEDRKIDEALKLLEKRDVRKFIKVNVYRDSKKLFFLP
jgi:hypothetical protein